MKPTKRGAIDRQGNTYAVEGAATVVKRNDAGAIVWQWNPPVADARHEILALWVDPFDFVYVGVSGGGSQATAKLWRAKQRKGSETPVQVWDETPGAYIRKIVTRGDLVYTLQNMPDRAQAWVVVYRGGLSTGLSEAWRTEVAYPANSFALKDTGDVVGASLPNSTRGIDPRFKNFTERTRDWRLTDLADYDRRVWAWYKASDQPGHYGKKLASKGATSEGKQVPNLKDGDDLTVWFDSSGNARDLSLALQTGATLPKYTEGGIGGKPSIYFRGTTTLLDALQSAVSAATTAAYADAGRGLLPGYAGGKFAVIAVLRMEDERPTPTLRAVFGQSRATGSTAGAVSLFSNRNSAGAATSGVGSYVDSVNAAGLGLGAAGQPYEFRYDEAIGGNNVTAAPGNDTSTMVLTIVNDGGDNTLPDSAAITHSLLRVNGQPIDRWLSNPGSTSDAGFLGFWHGVAAAGHFRGHIAEIIVLRDLTTAPKGLLSHPNYPRNIGTLIANNWTGDPVPLSAATEMEYIEGMLAHEYGISHLLPSGAAIAPTFGPYVIGNYPHPFRRANGPPRSPGSGNRSEPYQMHTKNGCVWKLDGSKGELQWVVTGTSAEDGGGYGYSVAVDGDAVFSVGPKLGAGATLIDGTTSAIGTGNVSVRRFKDLNLKGVAGFDTSVIIGRDGWITSIGGWNAGTGQPLDEFSSTDVEIALDDKQNLYVPLPYAAIGPFLFRVYAGTADATGAYNVGNELLTYGTDQGYHVVLPPSPSYRIGAAYDFDRNPVTDARFARTEFAYLFTTLGVQKIRLVTATPVAGSPRQTVLYQVNGGVLRAFDHSTTIVLAGASTIAEPQLSPTAQYIAHCTLFGNLFLTDGQGYFYVSPLDDALRTWKPLDGGKMGPRRKLLCAWRGRAVMARGVDDPHIWDMSALGNPFGWDRFPQPPPGPPTRAVSGTDSRIGQCQDVINAIYPYSDDVLLFFCDRSIWAMEGDPAEEGRATGFKQVSSVVGGSFGRSVCSDPAGNVYFHGSQGGVFAISPGTILAPNSRPQSISDGAIFDELRDVDLSTYRAELAWNSDEDGLHVVFIPYATGSTLSYFWSRANGAWCPDQYAVGPTSLLVADGDLPGDRKILLGLADGTINFWDRDAKNDNGVAITHRTLIGPLAGEQPDFEYRFRDFNIVLARDLDGCRVNLYGSDTPDRKGSVRASFEVSAGRNATFPVSICAAYVWVELIGSNPNRAFSVESMRWMQVTRAGRRRMAVQT